MTTHTSPPARVIVMLNIATNESLTPVLATHLSQYLTAPPPVDALLIRVHGAKSRSSPRAGAILVRVNGAEIADVADSGRPSPRAGAILVRVGGAEIANVADSSRPSPQRRQDYR